MHRAPLTAILAFGSLVATIPAMAAQPVIVSNGATSVPTAPTPSGTLTVGITQPTSGTTMRGSGWAVVWINGARGTANSVTLTLGGRTVGSATSAGVGPIALAYDSTRSADGVQILTATVRDATGNTGTWSVSINVVNGATPTPSPST